MVDFYGILISLAYVFLGVVTLIVAKIIKDFLTPYKIDVELTAKDNSALGLTLTGYFAAVIIIFLGASVGLDPEEPLSASELAIELGIVLLYALGGIVALNLGRVIVDKLVLTRFSTVKEIIQDRNVGTAAVEAGCFVATGLIVAGSINGEGGGPLSALAFFGLGQVVLIIFSKFYQLITKYDVHAEIEKDNVAAGVALGSSMVAIGVVLLGATRGDFIGWTENLARFGYFAVLGLVLLLILRKVTDFLLLPGTTIAHEIATDRNINAAWIEGIVSIGMATIILFMI
jgi:uncharacterized membrane protein YjfL (UPF0719 family)